MTIEELKVNVEARMFHGVGHLRYGKRACGPDCLGCNALTALILGVHEDVCGCRYSEGEHCDKAKAIQELGKEPPVS